MLSPLVRVRVPLLIGLCLVACGCAASGALRRARQAERRQDYDLAVVEYTKAVRVRPDDVEARAALDRAKIRASQDHFLRGRRFAATGKLEQALAEYEVAAELNPTSGELDDELRATRNKLRTKVQVAREGKTDLETLIDRQAGTGARRVRSRRGAE